MTTFTTREEYLAFRDAWKVQYKDLSIAIRSIKNAIAEMQSNGEFAGAQQNRLIVLKGRATDMLANRFAAKIRAGLLRKNPALTGEAYDAEFKIAFEAITTSHKQKQQVAVAKAKAKLAAKRALKKPTSRRLQAVA